MTAPPSNRSSAAAVPSVADLSDVEAQPVLDIAGTVEAPHHHPGWARRTRDAKNTAPSGLISASGGKLVTPV
ncbi:hypothetical protein JJE66_23670 [Bradyrhizobium diazoefficiens]|nr:hypothetical protein [Bradyrhizobium diazoefficiens]